MFGLAGGVERREVGAVDPEEAEGADQHQRHELQHRGDDLHDAGLGDAADVDERQRPDRDQRHGEARGLRGGDAGEEEADVAGERHRHPGVAGPERDPVAPGDDEAGELAEPGLGVGIGPAGLGHDPRQPPEDHRQHQRAERGHRPADERDRPEGGERGRQQEDPRADHVADDERGAGDEPEPAGRRHARPRGHRLSSPAQWRAPGPRRARPNSSPRD